MIYTLSNSFLSVDVSSHGGELRSVRTSDGREYLWQGSPQTWPRRAPSLFPFIGRLTDGYYTFKGNKYELKCHGFLRDNELMCEEQSPEKLVLFMEDNDETKKCFPFSFRCSIIFTLNDNKLTVSYKIDNHGNDPMYFGIGGHPGFNVPIDADLTFEDYHVAFESGVSPKQILMSEDYFMTKNEKALELNDKNQLELQHPLFDFDALVLHDAGSTVTISSDKSEHSVTMDFSDFDYIGLWHTPHSEAPFLCLEPWSSLPTYSGEHTDFETQDNLISVEGQKSCTKSFILEIK